MYLYFESVHCIAFKIPPLVIQWSINTFKIVALVIMYDASIAHMLKAPMDKWVKPIRNAVIPYGIIQLSYME